MMIVKFTLKFPYRSQLSETCQNEQRPAAAVYEAPNQVPFYEDVNTIDVGAPPPPRAIKLNVCPAYAPRH